MAQHRLRQRLGNEQGQALAMALVVMVVLGVLVVSTLAFTASDQRGSTYSKAAQVANAAAEAGVSDATAVLAGAAVPGSTNNTKLIPNSSCTSTLLPNSEATAASVSLSGATVKYWGYFDQTPNPNDNNTTDCQNYIWTLKAKATVANPTGPNAAAIVKTASAQVKVNAPTPKSILVNVWNTVYSPQGPTPGVCDTSIGQGINISVPIYVGGNLCMGQNATATKSVYVGGFLTFQNKQGQIGSNNAPITSAHVGSYCQVSSGAQVNPCKSEPVGGNNPNTNIWVSGAPTNLSGPVTDPILQGIAAPLICWGQNSCVGDPVGGWYSVASPGPLHPCEVTSGTPPTFDTNAPTMDNNVPLFNLTPAASYTCKTGQGELSWNATTRQLIVSGTVFIDGSITMTTSGNAPVTYTGSNGSTCSTLAACQSVIYASGDISINSEKLCAVLNTQGTDCDWTTGDWNPNNKILIFASNGSTGITVGPSQTEFQGGLYATNTVSTGQSAVTEGPLVSGTKTVVLGQQFGGTFPAITILPMSVQEPPGLFTISSAYNYNS